MERFLIIVANWIVFELIFEGGKWIFKKGAKQVAKKVAKKGLKKGASKWLTKSIFKRALALTAIGSFSFASFKTLCVANTALNTMYKIAIIVTILTIIYSAFRLLAYKQRTTN